TSTCISTTTARRTRRATRGHCASGSAAEEPAMRTHAFGRDGPSVGVIGQGTWQLERDRRRAVQALRCGVELGLRHVDSAEIYGDGEVERLVGEALRGRRDHVFRASKIHPSRAIRR